MNCDFIWTGEVNKNGVRTYQCSRPACRKGPWPSPSGRISARCRAAVGAGDVVAALTKSVGIQPCQGCKDRQAEWNKKTEEAKDRLHAVTSKIFTLGSTPPTGGVG